MTGDPPSDDPISGDAPPSGVGESTDGIPELEPGKFEIEGLEESRRPSAAETVTPIPVPPPEPTSSSSGWIVFLLTLLPLPVVILLAVFLTPVYQRFQSALEYPFQMDAEEGFVYQEAIDSYLGRPIYHPIDVEPYVVGNYPPLFNWTVAAITSPTRLGLPFGRSVVIFSSVLLAQILMLIVFWRTRRVLPSLLAPLLFMITYEFHNWSAFCRVDLPALMLTATGLFFFFAFGRRLGASVAALVFVLAAFTKQTAVLAPIACAIAMILYDRRRLPWFLIPYVAAAAAFFIYLSVTTHGEFYRHTVIYNRNAMDWVSFGKVMRHEIWYFYRWWIVALVVGIASLMLAGRPREPGPTTASQLPGVLGIYALLSALSLLSYAKVGSAQNYSLEPLAAAALFGMETLGRLLNLSAGAAPRIRVARFGAAFMCLALIVHAARLHATVIGRDMFSSPNPSTEDRQIGRSVLDIIQGLPGDALTDNPVFLTMLGRPVVFEPFILSRLAAEGLWDQSKLLKDIRANRFAFVLTMEDLRGVRNGERFLRFTPEMAHSVLAAYEFRGVLAPRRPGGLGWKYYLWTPSDVEPGEEESQRVASAPPH